MKIVSVADIHINLHKKKVPYDWQYNRFKLLFDKLLDMEQYTDITVISGDIFDKKPEPDEICLFLSYANSVRNPTIAIPGNHESTSKGKSFLEHFEIKNAIKNPQFQLHTRNERVSILGQTFQLFPYGEMQIGNIPKYHENDILVTHIRGEVPPHITAEFDFERLRPWKLILLGDLHFQHSYKDFPAYYPGSPLNTTFDRDENRIYGVDVIDFDSIEHYTVRSIDLQLPKLLRKTVEVGTELVPIHPHHVVYEITGSIDKLSKIQNHELLDKRIAEKPTEQSKLDLSNKTLIEELDGFLSFIRVENKDSVLKLFSDLGIRL